MSLRSSGLRRRNSLTRISLSLHPGLRCAKITGGMHAQARILPRSRRHAGARALGVRPGGLDHHADQAARAALPAADADGGAPAGREARGAARRREHQDRLPHARRHAVAGRRADRRADEFRHHRRARAWRPCGTRPPARRTRCARSAPRRRCRSSWSPTGRRSRRSRTSSEGDKIAVPAIKMSNQAICLQMAAAKEWGQAQYARLDPFTITLPHPDAAIAIIAKSTEVDRRITASRRSRTTSSRRPARTRC